MAADDKDGLVRILGELRAMLGVLGLDPLSPQWESAGDDLSDVVDALVSVALEQRQAARARKDYAAADAIRDRLAAAGIIIEDTPRGPRWELKRS
jgi:cysteinyl-tRNA synthetase